MIQRLSKVQYVVSKQRQTFGTFLLVVDLVLLVGAFFAFANLQFKLALLLTVVSIGSFVANLMSLGMHRLRSANPTKLSNPLQESGALASCGGWVLHADTLSYGAHSWPLAGINLTVNQATVSRKVPDIMIKRAAKYNGAYIYEPIELSHSEYSIVARTSQGLFQGSAPRNPARIRRFVQTVNSAAGTNSP